MCVWGAWHGRIPVCVCVCVMAGSLSLELELVPWVSAVPASAMLTSADSYPAAGEPFAS